MAATTLFICWRCDFLLENVFENILKTYPENFEYERRATLSLLIFQFQKLPSYGFYDLNGDHPADHRLGNSCTSLFFVPHDVGSFAFFIGAILLYRHSFQ